MPALSPAPLPTNSSSPIERADDLRLYNISPDWVPPFHLGDRQPPGEQALARLCRTGVMPAAQAHCRGRHRCRWTARRFPPAPSLPQIDAGIDRLGIRAGVFPKGILDNGRRIGPHAQFQIQHPAVFVPQQEGPIAGCRPLPAATMVSTARRVMSPRQMAMREFPDVMAGFCHLPRPWPPARWTVVHSAPAQTAASGVGGPKVHQAAEQPAPGGFLLGELRRLSAVLRHFVQQDLVEISDLVKAFHGRPPESERGEWCGLETGLRRGGPSWPAEGWVV